MGELKVNRPASPSLRGTIILRSTSRKNKPCKELVCCKKSSGGRNAKGHITVRCRGAGNKQKYRIIAFKKTIFDVKAKVASLEYDPNRNAEIALLQYDNGQKEYTIAVDGLKVGDTVVSSKSAESVSIRPGVSLPLSEIPIGVNVCCVELKPGCGAKMARSAGSFIKLAGKENDRDEDKELAEHVGVVGDEVDVVIPDNLPPGQLVLVEVIHFLRDIEYDSDTQYQQN